MSVTALLTLFDAYPGFSEWNSSRVFKQTLSKTSTEIVVKLVCWDFQHECIDTAALYVVPSESFCCLLSQIS